MNLPWLKKTATEAEGIGSNDSPAETISEDLFDVRQYVKGLSDFITACETPMTISIQGDWGSGKTSMMNMVREELGDKVESVWFNTWQYSQFNMGSDLTISFLGKLIEGLKPEKESGAKIKETIKKTYKTIKKAGIMTVDHFVGGMAAEEVEKLVEKFASGDDDEIEAINNLKKEFEECVAQRLAEVGKDRAVVFIDDLDRLNPGKAVELLEVLKVFLDCDKCVFVLAIDYAVVSQGVKEKYGDYLSEDKGRSFFDKIIQVPFKMPVAHYKVDQFLVEMFKQVGIDLNTDQSADTYVKLIQTSVGCNPRTMKRLFNAYLLLTCISQNVDVGKHLNDEKDGNWYKEMLFAVLCCQLAFEDLYNFLVMNHGEFDDGTPIDGRLLDMMCVESSYEEPDDQADDDAEVDSVDDQYRSLLSGHFMNQDDVMLEGQTEERTTEQLRKKIAGMIPFIKLLHDVVSSKNGDEKLDQDEWEGFCDILELTTVTSADNSETSTTRGTTDIVENISQIGLSPLQETETEKILAKIQEFGDMEIEYRKTGSGGSNHIIVRTEFNGKKRNLFDIYFRKQGLGIDCSVKGLKFDPKMKEIAFEKNGNSRGDNRFGISVRFDDEESINDFVYFAKACYDNQLKQSQK